MAYELIKLEHKDLVGTLTLNRPEKLNAWNQQMREEFELALDEAGRSPEIKVLVLRGAGRAFSAGNDLGGGGGPVSVDADRLAIQQGIERWLKVWDLPKPVIAMVHGYCLGVASQLSLLCDMAFVAENAVMGFPSIPLGGGNVSPVWSWRVGPDKAKYMDFLPGSQITGKQAEVWGWATRCFPADKLEEETYRYARTIAKVPGDLLYMKKIAINRTMELQGFRATIMLGAEYDALAHAIPGVAEIRQKLKELGLRGAIDWYRQE